MIEVRVFADASVGCARVGKDQRYFAGVAWKIMLGKKRRYTDSRVIPGVSKSDHAELHAIANAIMDLALIVGDRIGHVQLVLHTDNEHAFKVMQQQLASPIFSGRPIFETLASTFAWRVAMTKDHQSSCMQTVDQLSRKAMKDHRAGFAPVGD